VKEAESSLISYKGIPFAAPPVGELRWKAPQALEPWEGILECDAFGPSPVQGKPMAFMFWSEEFLIPADPISEDCLYLNVWTEAETIEEKLPVIVYIYGGGFRSGGSGCAIYDGASMASKGVVFVSINYRVGLFGFLAHPELTAESEYGSSGNYGILDMIAALKWVNRNISQFGGDPGNVTIAGQSAGAFGVNYLTVSPLARGTFHRALLRVVLLLFPVLSGLLSIFRVLKNWVSYLQKIWGLLHCMNYEPCPQILFCMLPWVSIRLLWMAMSFRKG
jgi:para-nitrobenzyl esterase